MLAEASTRTALTLEACQPSMMTVVKDINKLNTMPRVNSGESIEACRLARRSITVDPSQDPASRQSHVDSLPGTKDHIKAVKDWLSPINSYQKQADVFTKAQTGTGQWFLKHEVFESWTTDGRQVLWCHGPRKSSVTFGSVEV